MTTQRYMRLSEAAESIGLPKTALETEVRRRRLRVAMIAGRKYTTAAWLAEFQQLVAECGDAPLKRDGIVERSPQPMMQSEAARAREGVTSLDAARQALEELRSRSGGGSARREPRQEGGR